MQVAVNNSSYCPYILAGSKMVGMAVGSTRVLARSNVALVDSMNRNMGFDHSSSLTSLMPKQL